MTCYECNKISILSDNLFMNSDSNGIIKLIDKRIGRVVSIRDLNE